MASISYNNYYLQKQKFLMATAELPSQFELIVIGTGLEESIVAAAASRLGHSVLHVDINQYYGSQWTGFTLDGIRTWADKHSEEEIEQGKEQPTADDLKSFLKEDESYVLLNNSYKKAFKNIKETWNVEKEEKIEESKTEDIVEISKADTKIEQIVETSKAETKTEELTETTKAETKTEELTETTKAETKTEELTETSKAETKTEELTETSKAETTTKELDETLKGELVEKDETTNSGNEISSKITELMDETKTSITDQFQKAKLSPQKPKLTQDYLMSQSRRFSLDLFPHLLFSRGSMVELLMNSNISRYTEFRAVSRVLTVLNGVLEHVPSSRSDVFTTKHITVIEKRILMKFINFCVTYETQPQIYQDFKDKTFLEFLKSQKLTEKLIHFVQYSIAMVNDQAGCVEGLESTKMFLTSLGRFGNTPFLWPMYGSGELPQAFCRLSAVFGGVYYLDRPIEAVVIKLGRVVAIVTGGQRIDCGHLIMNSELCPPELKAEFKEEVTARKICIMTQSILPTDNEQISFLCLTPKLTSSNHFVSLQEVGFSGAVCPKGFFILHLATPKDESCPDVLQKSLEIIIKDTTKLLWSLDFDIRSDIFPDVTKTSSLPNLFLCSGPTFEVDFDFAIEHAKKIFKTIFPADDFLPRAPDPEEILIGGCDENGEESEQEMTDVGANENSDIVENGDSSEVAENDANGDPDNGNMDANGPR